VVPRAGALAELDFGEARLLQSVVRSLVRGRSSFIIPLVIAGLLVGAGGMYAYDRSQGDLIAHGISVGGIDIGGLTVAKARSRLRAELLPHFNQPVVARYHTHRYVLSPRADHLAVDIDGAIERALQRSRDGNIFVRVFRSLTGGHVDLALQPQVDFSKVAVGRLVDEVTSSLDHPARDASISYSADSVGEIPSQTGLSVDAAALKHALQSALQHPTVGDDLTIPVRTLTPKIPTGELAGENPTIITVDRGSFQLRLWKHLKLVSTYPIAVGMQGLETPGGLYHIQWKQVDPPWYVPNDSWAGSLAGTVVPPGPADPLKARFLSFDGGAGIHGIDPSEYGTIGHDASHGCIRMTIPDVIALYAQTPVGSPVYIG